MIRTARDVPGTRRAWFDLQLVALNYTESKIRVYKKIFKNYNRLSLKFFLCVLYRD